MKAKNAKPLYEEFPDVEYVTIFATMYFASGTGVTEEKEKEYNIRLDKDNMLYVHFPCINDNCTGLGFDVTEDVRSSIRKREEVTNRIQCSGKEDWKYYGSAGCSCDTTLSYVVTPHFS